MFAFGMSYQPIHLVRFLDLDGVAQAQGSQEQLFSALGRMEEGLVTSFVPRTQSNSKQLVTTVVHGYFKTKNIPHPPATSAVIDHIYPSSQELPTKPQR